MPPTAITRRVKFHNGLQWVYCLGLIPCSLFLWWLSFWFFRVGFYYLLGLFVDDAWATAWYVAWCCMIPLVIEGIRDTRPLFDLVEYGRSGWADFALAESQSARAIRAEYGDPLLAAYLASQIVFAAPRTLVLAIKSLRNRLPDDTTLHTQAAQILSELRATRCWTPAETYTESGRALQLLNKLDLIWMDLRNGILAVRYPAATD